MLKENREFERDRREKLKDDVFGIICETGEFVYETKQARCYNISEKKKTLQSLISQNFH